jgi:hypothetical protein
MLVMYSAGGSGLVILRLPNSRLMRTRSTVGEVETLRDRISHGCAKGVSSARGQCMQYVCG